MYWLNSFPTQVWNGLSTYTLQMLRKSRTQLWHWHADHLTASLRPMWLGSRIIRNTCPDQGQQYLVSGLHSEIWFGTVTFVQSHIGSETYVFLQLTCMFTDTSLWYALMEYVCAQVLNIIIPLRPYLEKIKGCRWLDIFHIRPWVHQDALYLAESAYLMSMHAYPPTFSSSCAVRLVDFPRNRGTFGRVGFACYCAYFQYIL